MAVYKIIPGRLRFIWGAGIEPMLAMSKASVLSTVLIFLFHFCVGIRATPSNAQGGVAPVCTQESLLRELSVS